MKTAIDKKWLDGLTFTTSVAKKVKEDGVERTRYVPVERPLAPEDVLDWAEGESDFVIVAKDGRKHRVKKGAKKAKAE